MATKKANNKNEIKIDFNDSIKAIKSSATTVNKTAKKAATEVMEDIKTNTSKITDFTTKKVKEVYSTTVTAVQENTKPEVIAATAKSVNNMGLKVADTVVEGITNNSDKWTKISEKALKNSLKLTAKQQEIFFDTIEDVKGQVAQGVQRFKKIFSAN